MKHILFDLKYCISNDLLDDEEYVKESLKLASEAAGCEILKIDSHKFDPQGVTAYALLAESHISIHTWPEKNVAKCDIFTCGVFCVWCRAVAREFVFNADLGRR